MVKVLYVADTFLPKRDGVVKYMLETAKRFKKVKVRFLVPDIAGAREAAEHEKLEAIFCPISRFKISDYPPAKPKSEIIKSAFQSVELVILHSIAPLGAATLIQAKKAGLKTIEIIHSLDWELLAYGTRFPQRAIPVVKRIVRYLYNKNDLLIVASDEIRTILRELGVKKPIKIIPLGIGRRFKKDLQMRVLMRRKLKLQEAFVIGYLGRLSPEKNLLTLYRAFKRVKNKIPKAHLLLIGGGAQESLFKNKEGVTVTGFVDNPYDFLQAVDVFVMPSKTETTALALMEAMAEGLPVVTSAVGAIPSYIESGHNGILIARDSISPQMLANAIEILYSSPRLRRELAENAVKTILRYTWDRTATELEHTILNILK